MLVRLKQFKNIKINLSNMGDIYIVRSISNKIYVGQTTYDYLDRWRDHIYDALDPKKDHCKKLNRAIRKYGKNTFYVGVLKECSSINELNHYEDLYIRVFDSIKNGYNIKNGGQNGKHSDETKKKIGDSVRGVPKSESMKKNLSKSRNKHGFPMYLIKHKNGYRVVNHPKQYGKEKSFTSSHWSDEQKYALALEYLNNLNKL